MLDRFRTLLGKGAKTPMKEISFEDLPSYIQKREDLVQKNLDDQVNVRRPQIVSAIDNVQELLDTLSDSKHTPSSHPKLEKIAQSSLPHFVRSFRQHINRSLPQEPDAFYHEVSLLLKGCITAMKGAGKYLPAVYPDEMKALRHEVGIIGRTMNELTALFSRARHDREQLSSLRTEYELIQSLLKELDERRTRITILDAQINTLKEERVAIQRSLETLQKSDAFASLVDQQVQLARLEDEVRILRRKRDQTLGVMLSVYRKAARIARHQNNRESERMIEESIDLIESSHHECEQIRDTLQRSLLFVTGFVRTGVLTLKGQDEQSVIASPETIPTEIYLSCIEIQTADKRLEAERRRIHETPIQIDLERTKGEEGRIVHTYEKVLHEREEQEIAVKSLPKRISTLMEELKLHVSSIFEGECVIVMT